MRCLSALFTWFVRAFHRELPINRVGSLETLQRRVNRMEEKKRNYSAGRGFRAYFRNTSGPYILLGFTL